MSHDGFDDSIQIHNKIYVQKQLSADRLDHLLAVAASDDRLARLLAALAVSDDQLSRLLAANAPTAMIPFGEEDSSSMSEVISSRGSRVSKPETHEAGISTAALPEVLLNRVAPKCSGPRIRDCVSQFLQRAVSPWKMLKPPPKDGQVPARTTATPQAPNRLEAELDSPCQEQSGSASCSKLVARQQGKVDVLGEAVPRDAMSMSADGEPPAPKRVYHGCDMSMTAEGEPPGPEQVSHGCDEAKDAPVAVPAGSANIQGSILSSVVSSSMAGIDVRAVCNSSSSSTAGTYGYGEGNDDLAVSEATPMKVPTATSVEQAQRTEAKEADCAEPKKEESVMKEKFEAQAVCTQAVLNVAKGELTVQSERTATKEKKRKEAKDELQEAKDEVRALRDRCEQLEVSPIHESFVAVTDTPGENTYGLNQDTFGTLSTTPSVEAAKSSIDAQRSSAVSSQDVTTSSNLRETWSGVGINQFWASLNSSAVVPARVSTFGASIDESVQCTSMLANGEPSASKSASHGDDERTDAQVDDGI